MICKENAKKNSSVNQSTNNERTERKVSLKHTKSAALNSRGTGENPATAAEQNTNKTGTKTGVIYAMNNRRTIEIEPRANPEKIAIEAVRKRRRT